MHFRTLIIAKEPPEGERIPAKGHADRPCTRNYHKKMHLRVSNGTNNKQQTKCVPLCGAYVGDLSGGWCVKFLPRLSWVFVECKFVPRTPWSAEIRAVEGDCDCYTLRNAKSFAGVGDKLFRENSIVLKYVIYIFLNFLTKNISILSGK